MDSILTPSIHRNTEGYPEEIISLLRWISNLIPEDKKVTDGKYIPCDGDTFRVKLTLVDK
jgi:hypothetical protein